MASGDSDHIEVMVMDVTKKYEPTNAPSGSEDEGILVFMINYITYYISMHFQETNICSTLAAQSTFYIQSHVIITYLQDMNVHNSIVFSKA